MMLSILAVVSSLLVLNIDSNRSRMRTVDVSGGDIELWVDLLLAADAKVAFLGSLGVLVVLGGGVAVCGLGLINSQWVC